MARGTSLTKRYVLYIRKRGDILENASKALIIAGGVLIAILMISLILYARASISEYQNSKTELENVERIAKFNEQFAQYDRKDVAGYELISLANKVADYNAKYSNKGTNNEGYNAITLKINITKEQIKNNLSRDGTNIYLFKNVNINDIFTQSDTKNGIKEFIDSNLQAESEYGGIDVVSVIAKNIDSIFLTPERIQSYITNKKISEIDQKRNAIKKFNSLLSSNGTIQPLDISTDDKVKDSFDNHLMKEYKYKNAIYKYYEYIQFKRSIFSCKEMDYDNDTGRISYIVYKFEKIR